MRIACPAACTTVGCAQSCTCEHGVRHQPQPHTGVQLGDVCSQRLCSGQSLSRWHHTVGQPHGLRFIGTNRSARHCPHITVSHGCHTSGHACCVHIRSMALLSPMRRGNRTVPPSIRGTPHRLQQTTRRRHSRASSLPTRITQRTCRTRP